MCVTACIYIYICFLLYRDKPPGELDVYPFLPLMYCLPFTSTTMSLLGLKQNTVRMPDKRKLFDEHFP